jgi:vitamin B12 transporter
VNYNRESSDGFSAAEDPDDTGTFGRDGYTLDAFYGKLDIRAAEGITISPFFNYSRNEGEYDAGAFQDADNEYLLKLVNPGVQAQVIHGDLRINGGYNYTQTERAFITQFGENEFEGRFHNADVFANYSFTDHLKALAGVNFQDFTIPVAEEGEDDRNAQIISPYATLYLKDLGGFSTELGFRLNNHTEYGNNTTFSIAPAYMVTDRVKLFGSVSTGFKAPTLDELFGPFGANPDLDPQRSLYMNIGAESYLMSQTLKLSAQLFNRQIDDLIVFTFDQGYINRDRQDDYGVELSADWIVSSRLTAGAWYNFVDGEITTLDDAGQETTVSNLIRRPKHSFGAGVTWSATDNLLFRFDGEYNGERTDLFFNPENNFAQEEVTLGAYTLVNLYAEYRTLNNRITIFGDVKNLLNSDFTEVYGFNTTGTAVKTGVRVSF